MMDRVFFILYAIVMTIAYILLLPFLYFFSKQQIKYKVSIPARFFSKSNKPLKSNGIWFHVCSFGEARAIYPILDALPTEKLRLTTTTQTGHEAISLKTKDQSRYLPFEPLLFSWLKPQKVLLVMEAEFWFLLFALAKSRGAKTLLINARMSDRSFPKYKRISWLYQQIFKYVDEVYAQSEIDRERLAFLGAKNIKVIGNIKLANIPKVTKNLTKPKTLLICGASTHEGEENLIIKAFLKLKEAEPTVKLILAPRHPERFKKVSKMVEDCAKENHYSWHNYSQNEALNSDIIVADVLGELVNIYAISDVVILGGAFTPVGGHNAAEAAQFGCKIISGEHYFNQRDIFSMVEGITVVTKENLARRLQQHAQLISTKIKQRTDIEPILESIKREL
jgi:3-deoxy-D-manno-octulosonic-acid transferase